jgi:integrating conjugative element protein (TIGR03752 family)
MNNKPKMLIVLGGFCLALIFGIFWTSHDEHKSAESNLKKASPWDIASGDTNTEVLRTVVANQHALQKQNEKLQAENNQLKKTGVQSMKDAIKEATANLESKMQETKSSLEDQISGQKRTIENLEKSVSPKSTTIDGYSLNNDDSATAIGNVPDLSHVNTINNQKRITSNFSSKFTHLEEVKKITSVENNNDDRKGKKQKGIPYYTIPANSTLNHVAMMTSIIAEVPVSGHLISPAFPFKAIIGRKDLFAANGFSVPAEIAGIVVEGYSIGNMTMSCARPYVTRLLFVFNDGHFVVFPEKSQNDGTQIYPKDVLGYLSDPYGNTCITGKYITDAPKVIATMAALGGVAAGGNAVAQAQMTTMSNAFQSNSELTGDVSKYVGGSFIGGASQSALEWYKARASDVFDAVFIPATFRDCHTQRIVVTEMVLHIEQTIPIDLDLTGRTLRYATNQNIILARHLD